MANQIKAPINYPIIAGGKIVSGGTVLFGQPNVKPDEDNPATLKAVYLDAALTQQAENPQGISSDGVFDQADTGILYGSDNTVYSIVIRGANKKELSYIPEYDLSDANAAAAAQESASQAAASESNAIAAKNLTEALYTDFTNRYFGAYSADPSVDELGNPPSEGSIYFNTVSDVFYTWNGSAWMNYFPSNPNGLMVTATGTTTPRSLADRFGVSASMFDDGGVDTIYLSPTGDDSNDGLTTLTPIKTLTRAEELYTKYHENTHSTITIKLEAGTYTEGFVLSNIKNKHELIIEGNLTGGVPDVIIDGTTATKPMGLNFNSMNNVRVKNIKVQNFGGVGSGIIFQNGTRGVVDTCDSESNAEAGFNCSEDSEIVMVGVCNVIGNNITKHGVRVYRNSGGSISDNTNPITITGCTSAGLLSRDGSKVVTVDNFNVSDCNLLPSSVGVLASKDGYIELRTCNITNNSIGAYAENSSIIDTQTGTRNVSGNVRNVVIRDNSSDRSLFTFSALPMQTWVPNSTPSGLVGNSGYDLVVDYDGSTGMQWLVNGNNVNINFDKRSTISYVGFDYSLRFTVNGTETIRLIDAPTGNRTSMLLLVNDGSGASLRQVKVGAVDSGGAGQRLLTVDN